jgi:hypothetical protein
VAAESLTAFRRADGRFGIRNLVAIIPVDDLSNAVCENVAKVVPGTVARKAFLGDLMRYWVTVDGREWIVDQPDPGAATPYDGAVQIAIRPERIHVIAEAPV